MRDQARGDVARERNCVLRELAAKKNRRFRESFVGRTIEAITLACHRDGHTEALSDNYLKVHIAGEHAPNQWMKVCVVDISSEGLLAIPI